MQIVCQLNYLDSETHSADYLRRVTLHPIVGLATGGTEECYSSIFPVECDSDAFIINDIPPKLFAVPAL